ncbi:FAD-dependent oxidoreductase [Actinomadura montaniterrae]|uniref:FAD-binding protein n=1 Tax=Actinomadura montaniterrae TaxID=1803903 RepID=A0A6L3VZC3_9ACTN|nr:FAD-dependent oxidoreductase [Actinomadura montaniterrae]KAB2386316.1 FAD-binding protein [Actinomadura montaniterrae]
MTWDTEVDVAVIGGGACGVMTALRAARDPGRVVAVFEKSTREGCNAAISSGSLAAGGTRFQAAAGIDDSPQRHAGDILRASGDEEWRPVVEALCEAAPRIVEWIADTGYPIEIGTDMPRAGMTALRLHTDTGRLGGARLMRHLRALLDAHDNAAFVDEAPAVDLVSDGGAVTGVVVAQNGALQRVRAGAVVLATDGFAADQALVKRYLPHLGTPFYGGVSTSTGDALAWAGRLGAQVRNMGAGLRSGLVVVDHGTRVSPALPFNGAVLVNLHGERFVDEESKGYSSMAGVLQRQPGERAAMIWDATAMAATRESEMMRESLAAGAVRDCATLDDLAAALGRTADETGRALAPLPGRRRLTAPYHLAWVTHGLLTTQGGLVIDPSGRVLDGTGEPVPGLYAGGGAACGLAGPHSDGYLSGNGLLSAFGMGWIIGNGLTERPADPGGPRRRP